MTKHWIEPPRGATAEEIYDWAVKVTETLNRILGEQEEDHGNRKRK